jgi:hypothetical protein
LRRQPVRQLAAIEEDSDRAYVSEFFGYRLQ